MKVASIGSIKPDGNPPVVWRGPMLHRALQQFLADFYWGDLDYLLLDLPPGTGDVAISVAQLLPNAEILVVTTPQLAAAEVAERAGSVAQQTRQRIAGVIENMSYLACPHCGERMDIFGSGGGEAVSRKLTQLTGATVPLLGQIPLDTRLREGGDNGTPLVLVRPRGPGRAGAVEDRRRAWPARGRGLAGRMLTLTPELIANGRQRGQAARTRGRETGPAASAEDQVASRSKGGRSSTGPRGDCLGARLRAPAVSAGAGTCGSPRRLPPRPPAPGSPVRFFEQVLLDEAARVQVLEVEVLELWPESLTQVRLGPLGYLPQVAQRPPSLPGDPGQLIRPEDHERDHGEEQQLGDGQVKHA